MLSSTNCLHHLFTTPFHHLRCFNAHKHWVLGWYKSRSISVDLSGGPWAGSVVAFTDYNQAGQGEYVIVSVNSLYIQYNKAEEFNAETGLLPNQLVIVHAQNDDSVSDLMGGLESVPGAIIRVEVDGEPDLLIIICSTSEVGDKSVLAISIYLETQSAQCGPRSTPKPTPRPNTRRTRRPTPNPTPNPTANTITNFPTRCTRRPTAKPTTRTTKLTTTVMCDDSRDDMFFVDNKFEHCIWLAVRPELHPSLCHEDHPSQAREVCPKTCGKCKDECKDDLTFNFIDRGFKRDCTWLSLRNLEQARICTPGHEIYTRCQEACNVCDGRISS